MFNFFFIFSSDVWKILREKNFEKFDEILHEKPNIINSLRGGLNGTLLMLAVFKKRFDIFVHLMKHPQDFSLVDFDGWNVLHYVGYRGNVEHLEMFDQQTIEMLINRTDNVKQTPLHIAVWNNNHDVIRWLLAKGGNPDLKDKDGRRPDERPECGFVTKEIFRSFRSSW